MLVPIKYNSYLYIFNYYERKSIKKNKILGLCTYFITILMVVLKGAYWTVFCRGKPNKYFIPSTNMLKSRNYTVELFLKYYHFKNV